MAKVAVFRGEFRKIWRSVPGYHYSLGGFAQFGTRPCYWSVSLEVRRVSSFAGGGVSEDGGDSVRFEGKSQRMGDYFQFFSGCR